MRKLVTIALVASLAGFAFADRTVDNILVVGKDCTVTATPLNVERSLPDPTTVYSQMNSGTGWQAFTAANGYIGYDDYTADAVMTGTEELTVLRFVGGVADVGGVMFFEFYDADQNFLSDFGLPLSSAGNYIWTITLGPGSGVNIDPTGIMQVWVDDGSVLAATTGQWFASDAAPTIGSEDPTFGALASYGYSQAFELTVPEPASLLLLGLAGLLLRRR